MAAFACTILARSLAPAIGMYLLGTALIYATFGPLLTAVQEHSPPDRRAGAAGLFYFVLNLVGLGAGNLVIGALSDALRPRFGPESLRYAILLDLTFLLAGAGLLLLGARLDSAGGSKHAHGAEAVSSV